MPLLKALGTLVLMIAAGVTVLVLMYLSYIGIIVGIVGVIVYLLSLFYKAITKSP